MNYTFGMFRLNEARNFLAVPHSEEHGIGYILHDDVAQLGAGLLIENLGDATGMIVFVKDDEIAYVVKNLGNQQVSFIEYHKADYKEAGKVYRETNVDYFGILIDMGESEDGRRKYSIVSHDTSDFSDE